MPRDHTRVNMVGWVVAGIALAVVFSSLYYASAIHVSPVRCVFGDPQCSQTVATYVLCFMTAGAFLATIYTVMYSRQMLTTTLTTMTHTEAAMLHTEARARIDRTPVMTLRRCLPKKRHDDPGTEDLEFYLTDGKTPALRSDAPKDSIVAKGLPQPYTAYAFDVLSLGRAPVINGKLYIDVEGRTEPCEVDVGSVPPNHFVHLVLWVNKSFEDRNVRIAWAAHAADDSSETLRYYRPRRPDIGTFDYSKEEIGVGEGLS